MKYSMNLTFECPVLADLCVRHALDQDTMIYGLQGMKSKNETGKPKGNPSLHLPPIGSHDES